MAKRKSSSPRKDRYVDAKELKEIRAKKAAIARRRAHAERIAVNRKCCHNPEVRKGLGAVIIAIGVLTLIIGIIMTVVDATDNSTRQKYPDAFAVVGPLLIVLAAIFFIIGFSLSTPFLSDMIDNCLSDPKSFCRVKCPRLTHFLKPDDTIIMNQHAMKALQSEPGRSALKRQAAPEGYYHAPNHHPDDVPQNKHTYNVDTYGLDMVPDAQCGYSERTRLGSKGVRFSESDGEGFYDRRDSVGDPFSESMSSAVSLKHCKVHPQEGVWWTPTSQSSNQINVPDAVNNSINSPAPVSNSKM